MTPTVERQIEQMREALALGLTAMTYRSVVGAVSCARRALSIGNLPRLKLAISRKLAEGPAGGYQDYRALLAILESILARRKAARRARRMAVASVATLARPTNLPPPYSAPGCCPECGQEPGRAASGKQRVYDSPRCRSLAYQRRNRPAEYLRRRARMGSVVAVVQRGYDHATAGPTMEGVHHP